MTGGTGTGLPHICSLVTVLDGEAVCFECGAYYIYRATLDAEELSEMQDEAKALGRV